MLNKDITSYVATSKVHYNNFGATAILLYIVAWEKLVVGNIHEKKFRGKKFSSQQATNHYKLLYFFVVRKFSSYVASDENFSRRIFPKLR